MLKSTYLVLLLTLTIALIASAPLEPPTNNFVVLHTNSPFIRRLYRRAVNEDIIQDANEYADKDYDMELAEVNVFRPVFRYRASYARRGG
ncbi:hypothetical protein DOY81_014761 [Sarcophaga bullata]|nr:hypothetical protein DOY81_014761 [Sarcophaga bullata]